MCPQLKTTFSTDSRVQNMFDILLDEEMEKDKREKVGILPVKKHFYVDAHTVVVVSLLLLLLLCIGCQQSDCAVKRGRRSRENLPE